MAKKSHKCESCGKTFEEKFRLMLHYDFHKGEPVVREVGCYCGYGWDVRNGKCGTCGETHTRGWRVIDGVAVTA